MSTNKEAIIFIHQSSDLYGSDKMLLYLLQSKEIQELYPIVLVPCPGPLMSKLEDEGIEVHVCPVGKVSRSIFNPRGIVRFCRELFSSYRQISEIVSSRSVSIVYSNTLAVLGGGIWALLNSCRHIWHVHEIIERPLVVRWFYEFLLKVLSTRIVCNSEATRQAISKYFVSLADKSVLVYNGLPSMKEVDDIEVHDFKRQVGINDNKTVITLVGRINRWKGHLLLVQAISELMNEFDNLAVLFVGGPPDGQDNFLLDVKREIDNKGLQNVVTICDYMEDVRVAWAATDIAVVPSTEPEPFGMVAVEAMLMGKPVIAADHGGLAEIVVDGSTGYKFSPNDPSSLINALKKLLMDNKILRFGLAGKDRAVSEFGIDTYHRRIIDVIKSVRSGK